MPTQSSNKSPADVRDSTSPHQKGRKISKFIAYFFATGFGIGYMPLAPGTAGSLLALLVYFFLPMTYISWLIISFLFLCIGLWAGGILEKEEGKDPGIIVIDEMVGQWCALLFLPLTYSILIMSFLLFRLLDIIKPYPAGRLERLKGGSGIMLDDIIAGIYTNIILQLISRFL
jgi:phosphatidylglycerophosphatase A